MKKLLLRLSAFVPAFAVLIGVTTATQACAWWFHQPKVPNTLTAKTIRKI